MMLSAVPLKALLCKWTACVNMRKGVVVVGGERSEQGGARKPKRPIQDRPPGRARTVRFPVAIDRGIWPLRLFCRSDKKVRPRVPSCSAGGI